MQERKIKAVIFDWNRTLVQGDEFPPRFFPDTPLVLKNIKVRGIPIAVVSVGENRAQRMHEFTMLKIDDKLGLDHYISVFRIVGRGDSKDMQPVLGELHVDGKSCVVVGDRIKKEIVEGNRVGAITVWLQQGKFANEKPETSEETPDYTINSLGQLLPILDSLK